MSDPRFDYRQMTEPDPSTLIERHKLNYWYEYIITGMAGLSNLAWIYFGKDLIPKGIEGTIQLFSPDYEMAPEMVEPLGWTLASISCAFYMLALKPAERARLSTVEYAQPLKEKLTKLCKSMRQHPVRSAVDALNFTALNTATYAGAHSLFIPAARLSQEWFDLEEGSPQWWALFAGMHYLGFKYYKDFVRDLFYQGVDFIFDSNRSWLFSNFCRDTARITQLLLSVGCAIALKTIQNMGVVNTGNNEFDFKSKVGFEMPPAFVGVMSAWAYVFIMYPLLHEHYYGARNKGVAIITSRGFSSVRMHAPEFDIRVDSKKEKTKWTGVIKASPAQVLLPMITFSGVIGFQAYKALSSIPGEPQYKLYIDHGVPPLLSLAAAVGFFRGERNRVIEGVVLQEMQRETGQEVQNDSCGVVAAATSLTVVNTIVDSSMAASFVPNMVGKSPGAVAAGLGAILYAAVTGVCFGANKMVASFRNLCGSRPSRNGIYSRTKPTVQVAQDDVQLDSIVSSPPSPTSLLK